jgi:EAL domain-containing protein (putative c-di-GMP-specific phosphodiesterase class I)
VTFEDPTPGILPPAELLNAAVAGTGLTTVYQPIVLLPDRQVIGYEALARWPPLSNLRPQSVFAHAAAIGAVETLDRLCAESAFRGAIDQNLPAKCVLLVNSEPTSAFLPDTRSATIAAGLDRFQVVIELTERDLLARPGALLHRVAALRDRGCGVALDDVGAHPDSLAVLDIVCPDLVKLDIGFVQSALHGDSARTLSGVLDYCQRSGALIVAEGIETSAHYEQALTVGASIGQGFYFGHPDAVDCADAAPVTYELPMLQRPSPMAASSVFDLIGAKIRPFTGWCDTAAALSCDLARKAAEGAYQPMVLAAIDGAVWYTGQMSGRYRALAAGSPLVAVFGTELPADLGGGVRGVSVPPDDPLATEWLTLILDCDVSAALAVRPRPYNPSGKSPAAQYDLTITRDRALVADAARSILNRMP